MFGDCDLVDPSRTLLGYYEAIGHASQLMLRAASRSDWRSLEHAHACCQELIRCVQASGLRPDGLDPHARRRRMEILRQVLADDARIRDLTEPSLGRVDELLAGERLAMLERGP